MFQTKIMASWATSSAASRDMPARMKNEMSLGAKWSKRRANDASSRRIATARIHCRKSAVEAPDDGVEVTMGDLGRDSSIARSDRTVPLS